MLNRKKPTRLYTISACITRALLISACYPLAMNAIFTLPCLMTGYTTEAEAYFRVSLQIMALSLIFLVPFTLLQAMPRRSK